MSRGGSARVGDSGAGADPGRAVVGGARRSGGRGNGIGGHWGVETPSFVSFPVLHPRPRRGCPPCWSGHLEELCGGDPAASPCWSSEGGGRPHRSSNVTLGKGGWSRHLQVG